jgi:1,2-dihydroxy-3-keto-5-methylthiopentene dioxygenase
LPPQKTPSSLTPDTDLTALIILPSQGCSPLLLHHHHHQVIINTNIILEIMLRFAATATRTTTATTAFLRAAPRRPVLLVNRKPLSTAAPVAPTLPPVAPTPPPAAVEPEAYSKALSLFHWAVGLSMIGSIGAVLQAQQVKGKEKGVWMFRHKSLGLLAGILVAPRVLLRVGSKIPGPMKEWSSVQTMASKAGHAAMYAFMLVMPATGIAMGYYGGKGLPFFWTTIDGAATANGEIAKQSFNIHKQVGTYGKYLVPLHMGAAVGHVAFGQKIFARINPFR